MRETIDFGIDLGTTNSAVAVVDDGEVGVIKANFDQRDTTPSVVRLTRNGAVQVGQKARNAWDGDPDNVAAEFKLEMGLANARRHFPATGTTLTPPELSAEVLKSLRADVLEKTGEQPDSVVVTVPAAFSLNQNKATTEAAALAGFTGTCLLVQEPTAAAFAYGVQDSADRAYWMVFDFGGGTFDAAIVSKREGELRVLNHAGDPYLGGKLIDWAVVETLLAPRLAAELGRDDLHRENPDREVSTALRKLKLAAEQAKIELSTRDSTELDVDVTIGGRSVNFAPVLRRADVERLAEPFYARAVRCCRAALAEGGLAPGDIDRLLLVGGPTLAPGLRAMLADPAAGLGIELDVRQDPSTAVARGAALYASTVRLPRPAVTPKRGEIAVDLSYPATTSMRNPAVAGTLRGPADLTRYRVSLHNPDAKPPFHGDAVTPTAEGRFATDVPLSPNTVSRFTVRVTDAAGTPQRVTPDTLTITHRDTEVGAQVLSKPVGIGTADNTLTRLVAKGTALPHTVTRTFTTSTALHPQDPNSVLRIPVFEGDQPRADRNHQVGMLEIRARDVRYDLAAGSKVEVTLEVSTSGLLTVVADVLDRGTQFEAEINLSEVRAPEPVALAESLAEVEARMSRLGDRVGSADQFTDLRADLAACRDLTRVAGTDLAAARSAEEKILDLHAALDDIEDADRFPRTLRELQNALAECADLVDRHGRAADRRELDDISSQVDRVVATRDVAAVPRLLERIDDVATDILRNQPDWPAMVFRALRSRRADLRPAGEADALIRDGERLLGTGDMGALDQVNYRLRQLLPPDIPDPVGWLRPI
ncbi:MAG TPA: Hsp70 family protein [Pseudonocardiaceae bacterium]|nr:Hsp70 family protein [Pseudonocardiaceae bacterium]